MPTNDFSTSGTIKVKNADGVLVPFHPKTKTDCIYDVQSSKSLTTVISELEEDIEVAANSGGVKVTYDEVTDGNAVQYSNESMIVEIEPIKFVYTVDTRKLSVDNNMTGFPFYASASIGYNNRSNMHINWGDGTESAYVTRLSNSYGASDIVDQNQNLVHSYETPGIYKVTVYSKSFDGYSYRNFIASEKENSPLYYFRRTLVSIDTQFPEELAISNLSSYLNNYPSLESIPKNLFQLHPEASYFGSCFIQCPSLKLIADDIFSYASNATNFRFSFRECTSLTSIPENIFEKNINSTQFGGCFYKCTSLASIPENLFKYNTSATEFGDDSIADYGTFSWCTSLTSVPENLFRYNVNASKFGNLFWHCINLTSIPENLFRYNVNATSFVRCFWGCTSLTSIPENLFRYNVNATSFSNVFLACTSLNDFTLHIGSSRVNNANNFCTLKEGANRVVYVPSGSTTETTFNAIASDLGLTIIGE